MGAKGENQDDLSIETAGMQLRIVDICSLYVSVSIACIEYPFGYSGYTIGILGKAQRSRKMNYGSERG